jgi:FkbM family methyltransferase
MTATPKPARLARAQRIFWRVPPFLALQRPFQWLLDQIYPFEQAVADHYEFCEPSITGAPFAYHTADSHGYAFSIHGYIEWRSLALASAVCRPGDCIIEIGANLGTETISFADIVGSAGSVIAFEPMPELRAHLEANLRRNQQQQVQVLPYAVANTNGTVQFQRSTDAYNTGLGKIVAHEPHAGNTITVESITLDSIADQLPVPRMLHIDVEGAEPLVLQGGMRFITTHRPFIFMEVIHTHLANFGTTPAALMSLVQEMGYQVYILRILRGMTHPSPTDRRSLNWICIPNEQMSQFQRILTTMHLVGWSPPNGTSQPLAARQHRYASIHTHRI